MDFERRLADMVCEAKGVFDNIRWGTVRGRVMTLGTMSNDHLANSLYYHKHLTEVARVAPEMGVSVEECRFNWYLMSVVIAGRQVSGVWDIDESDFRLA